MPEISSPNRNRIEFEDEDEITDQVESLLKQRYGRGIFVDKYNEGSGGTYVIQLGNIVPKDVSDCREPDRVIKFISYKPIYHLTAEPNNGKYLIELPERSEIKEGFINRRSDIARRLDTTVAKTIYKQLVQFTSVEQQLEAIKTILWVIREKHPVPESEIYNMRGKDSEEQTERYLAVLRDTEFIKYTDKGIMPGDNLKAHDEHDVESDEFTEFALGQIVHRAYTTLRDELNLTLLQHYPKFAGSYYFSALQKNEPGLKLDSEAIMRNLRTIYDDDKTHIWELEKKLPDLSNVGVLDSEGEYYMANPTIYSEIRAQTTV